MPSGRSAGRVPEEEASDSGATCGEGEGEMITVAELKGLAANKALSIGEAWNALDAAAERIEDIEKRGGSTMSKGIGCFRIVRFFQSGRRPRTIKTGLTEEEAQAHCKREDTHGPGWFDGYDYMKGVKPPKEER